MLIQLAIKGLLVALLPLSMAWAARNADRYRKLVWITVFLTFDLIMFGAFTRLTDSGLGCPDWPGCFGQANPLQAMADIRAAEALLPDGPVTVVKAWIEMLHRYFAMGVGVLIIAIMALAWRAWLKSARSDSRYAPGLPTALFVFVCLQGAFGAWTVTLKLQPAIVTIHLLLGMGLLAMLAWLGARQDRQPGLGPQAASLRLPVSFALLLVAVQIALGGWVSTNYAVLACTDFPLCQDVLVPQMDFANGFALWRDLGKTATGEYLPFAALVAIHWTHRMFALVVVAAVAWAGYQAQKIASLRRTGRALLAVVILQVATGVSTIYLEWPLALAVMHNGGAALLVLLLVMLNYRARQAVQAESDQASARLSAA